MTTSKSLEALKITLLLELISLLHHSPGLLCNLNKIIDFVSFSYLKPSFRIYEFDAETNIPLNYHQFSLDLDKWNKATTEGPLEWDLGYSFLEVKYSF